MIDFFADHQMDHALIGGFALKAYGYMRATLDVDFILKQEDQSKIIQFLESLGFETLYRSKGYSNHQHVLSGLGRIDFVYIKGETAKTIFSEAKRHYVLKDVKLPVVNPKHLVALKIFAIKNDPSRRFREMADIQYLMRLPEVKTEEVKDYFEKHGLMDYFNEIIDGETTHGKNRT